MVQFEILRDTRPEPSNPKRERGKAFGSCLRFAIPILMAKRYHDLSGRALAISKDRHYTMTIYVCCDFQLPKDGISTRF